MAWNDLNPLKLPPETISIGFLLLLRSFWVVTWLVYDNLVFKAKIGQKWPEMAEKGPKWPKLAWMSKKWHPKPSPLDFCFSCGLFEWSHDQFTTILCFRPRLAKSGQKWLNRAPNDRNWPECLKSDIRNHLHWIPASLSVILSGHMTSLHQFWVWGQIGQKMAEKGSKWPKMAWKSEKWHSKPSPLDFCLSCDHFEWSHD